LDLQTQNACYVLLVACSMKLLWDPSAISRHTAETSAK